MSIKIKKLKPLFTTVVVTNEKFEDDVIETSGLIDTSNLKGMTKPFQKVVAIGDAVRNIKVGDYVSINVDRYAIKKYKENSIKKDILTNTVVGYNIPRVLIADKECMILQNSDIEFVIEEFEEVPDKSPTNLILNV